MSWFSPSFLRRDIRRGRRRRHPARHRGRARGCRDHAAARPDRFAETVIRELRARLFATLGQFDAAEAEVRLCWAAGRSAAVRLAEARLAAARGDTAAAALRRAAAASGAPCSFPPTWPTWRAWPPAPVTSPRAAVMAEAHAVLGGSRQAIVFAALRYAEGIMAWHQGEFASAERLVWEATVQWHHGDDRMDA